MRRPLLLLLAVAALAGVSLPGCGTTLRPPAATVNGEAITQEEFERELLALRNNADWIQAVEEQSFKARGDGAGSLTTALVSQILSQRIAYLIVEQELARRDVRLSAAEASEGREFAVGFAFGEGILEGFPTDYQEVLARRGALAQKLAVLVGRDVSDAEVRQFYDENTDLFAQTCVSHILFAVVNPGTGIDQVATAAQIDELRAQAAAVRAQLDGGADFATLAREHSVDPGSSGEGGRLGCGRRDQLSPELAAAIEALQPGQVSQPVETDFGVQLIRLDERRPQPIDEVADTIRSQLEQEAQAPFQELMSELLAKAEISVNPRYGTFEREGGVAGVRPPSGPTTTEAGAGDEPEGVPGLPVP